MPRYRFSDFTLSPQRRVLVRGGRELPLIPRYFDLLVFLIEHRHEAVNRQTIFDRVWSDAVVSDSALSQAIRTLRRTLDDDSREPRYIGTVSRHGYRFVYDGVIEEADDEKWSPSAAVAVPVDLAPPVVGVDWVRAVLTAAVAGVLAGVIGGIPLALAPDGPASLKIVPVIALIGCVCAVLGAGGVTLGLVAAEVKAGGRPAPSVLGAALGGALVGLVVQWLMRWGLEALVGVRVDVNGAVEGLVIGGAAGVGYVAGRDRPKWTAIALMVFACGLATVGLTQAGRPLVGGTLHAISNQAKGSQISLAPLGRLLGETDFGPATQLVLGAGEGTLFGLGLGLGLYSRRPRS